MIIDPRVKHRPVTRPYPGQWFPTLEPLEAWQRRADRRFALFTLRRWLRTMTGYVVAQDVHLWYVFPAGLTLSPLALPPPMDLTHLKEST